MPDFTWPVELDDARKLLGVVGSFWAETYAGNDLVASLLHAKAQHQAQAHLDFLDLLASISRFNVPVFHAENWTLLALRESELNAENLATFDGTYAFDGEIRFDEAVPTPLFVWQAPAGLVSAKVIMNQITDATYTCVTGVDFFLRSGLLWFKRNPFDVPGVRIDSVFESGVVVDRIAYLWAYRGEFDWDTVYKQFGYVLGAKLESSRASKAIVNAVYDGLVEGTSVRCVEELMSAICDVPLARTTETIKYILADAERRWVITDANAYGFALTAGLLVAVGDTVNAGDPLVDALQFFDFNRGVTPDAIRSLSLGRGILAGGYFQDIVFENKDLPILVTEAIDGYTRVELTATGWPGDLEKFWNDTHANGVAADATLAMSLDTRTVRNTQPTSLNLPETVNPLRYLVANLLRGNAFAIVVRPASFGPDALNTHVARFLRKLVPPQTLCLLIVQLDTSETINMTAPGTETTPGYEEEIELYLGNTIEETINAGDYVVEDVRITQIAGYCK